MVALFLGNEQTMFPLADVQSNQVSLMNSDDQQAITIEDPSVVGDGTPVANGTQGSEPTFDGEYATENPSVGENGSTSGDSDDNNSNGTINPDGSNGSGSTGNTGEGGGNTTDGTGENGSTGEGGSNTPGTDATDECPKGGKHDWQTGDDGKLACTKCSAPGTPGNTGDTGNTGGSGDETGDGEDAAEVCPEGGEHVWGEPDSEGNMTCSKCGTPKPDSTPNEGGDDTPGEDEVDVCPVGGEHEWEIDSDTGDATCKLCNAEKKHEHNWVPSDSDPEEEVCSICGKTRTDVAQEECEHEWWDYVPDLGKYVCDKCGAMKDCEHREWVTDPDTGEERCRVCGKLKSEVQEECDHDWVEDPETGLFFCSKCGMEMPCEHEWTRDSKTLEVVCAICGKLNEEYVEEDVCPESPWGFHIYEEKEDGTGYVCVLCGEEKDELDPLDVTVEMFLNSDLALNTLDSTYYNPYQELPAVWDNPYYSQLPKRLEDLEQYPSKTLLVASVGDLLVLQDLSKETDFSGYTISILYRSYGGYHDPLQQQSLWRLDSINPDIKGTDGKPLTFIGLGSEEFPFRGTFETNAGGTNFRTPTPLFNYLATSATIGTTEWDVNIFGDITENGGRPTGILARYLVKDTKDTENDKDSLTLNRVTLDGSVKNTNTVAGSRGAAGLVFGRVESRDGTLRLPYDSENLRLAVTSSGSVTGFHAGGFAGETSGTIGGEVKGEVIVDITDPGVMGDVTVSSVNVGASSNEGPFTWDATAAAGMYVGAMDKGTLRIAGNTYAVNVTGYNNNSYGSNGGFVGMAIDTAVTTAASEDADYPNPGASADNPVKIVGAKSGTNINGATSGGILGYFGYNKDAETPLLELDNISVSAYINGTRAGGVLGMYYRNMEGSVDKEYDTIDNITFSGNTIYGSFCGGVVGCINGSNLRIGGKADEGAYSINVGGTIYGSSYTGGVAGILKGQYVEIQNTYVNAALYYNASSYPSCSGGIAGYVGIGDNDALKSVVKVSDIKVDATFGGRYAYTSGATRGGVLGRACAGAMVALDDSIDINMKYYTAPYNLGNTGYIAGTQNEALIYMEDTAKYTRASAGAIVDDIGSYGGLYKNGTWGESAYIFSYEQAKVLGTVGGAGTDWTIDSEADFIRLAVMLNTEGRFASNCFGVENPSKASNPSGLKTTLLTAHYTVTKSLKLKDSGVYSLNRNDSISSSAQLFTGTFEGTGRENITINLGDITTRQAYVAFIPYVGNGAVIRGFTLKRTLGQPVLYGAGIACRSTGNFTAQDLYIDLTSDDSPSRYGINGFDVGSSSNYCINGSTIYANTRYYAGLVAYASAGSGTTFNVNNVKINGTIYGNNSYYYSGSSYYGYMLLGGMVAYYSGAVTSTISVDGLELMSGFHVSTANAYRISGMITEINTGDSISNSSTTSDKTKLSMTNITIHDGAKITQSSSNYSANFTCGGWLGYIWHNVIPDETKHYSINNLVIGDGTTAAAGPNYSVNYAFGGLVNTVTGRIQMKDINIRNGIFSNNSTRDGVGLLFREGINALIEIYGYTIDGRPIGETAPNNSGNVQFLKPGTNFDEIVAYNMGISTSSYNDYKTGGIVNIIYPNFSTGSEHHYVYQNRLHAPKNTRRTRYYYNLFGTDFENEVNYLGGAKLDGANITGVNQMMIWHLTQYMNASIRRFLKDYYPDGTNLNGTSNALLSASTTFHGKFDLDTVSYYPTNINKGTYTFVYSDSGEASEVIFYGEDIKSKAGAMTASEDSKEHFMLHAGLFLSKENASANDIVTVQGDVTNRTFLKLSGSVTNLSGDNDTGNQVDGASKNSSGALFCRDIKGDKNIYYISFNGLYVVDYAGEDPTGLMLGIVKDKSTLDISWIETVNYDYTKFGANKKAASALIGVVGNLNAKEISIEFTNMKLDSRKPDGIFRFASLIDENYYVEDTEAAKDKLRRLRYLFTYSAFWGCDNGADGRGKGAGSRVFPFDDPNGAVYGYDQYASVGSYVTVGYELGEGVGIKDYEGIEYWDLPNGPEAETPNTFTHLPFRNGSSFTWTQDNVYASYVPYVHTEQHKSSKNIEVNPKNRSITEGCGTYEDPYIINNSKQLLALARYLQNKDDYKYLSNWQIHQFESGRIGQGDNVCKKKHPSDDERNQGEEDKYLKTYRVVQKGTKWEVQLDDGFPTQDELSQAYYKIVGDLDLSKMSNSTDRVIAENFVGLGTDEIPFRGVIIGEYREDGKGYDENDLTKKPELTWPLKPNWASGGGDMNYGLIQYAMGAVVKDLRISAANNTAADGTKIDSEKTEVAKVKKIAGAVMADILGGDNIIDNVVVNVKVAVSDNTCIAGGYVGNVEQGSLILRNLREDGVSGFDIGLWNTTTNALTAGSQSTVAGASYNYVSGLIGKVEDGCVIYDDTTTGAGKYTGGPVIKHTEKSIGGIYQHEFLPICDHYDIILKSHLDAEKASVGPIMVTQSGNDFVAEVKSSSQLQIVSMVINSDAFSIYYDKGGYSGMAACRKAQYNRVGKVEVNNANATTEPDFISARDTDDAVYWRPYLYDYFNFTGVSGGDIEGTLIDEECPHTDGSVGGVTKYKHKNRHDYTSMLNAATKDAAAHKMTYNLVGTENGQSKRYNLAQYCRGFRGIGATYGMIDTVARAYYGPYDKVNNSFYSDFRANFNGHGATIELGLDRGYDTSIHTTALFNDLLDRDIASGNLYTIEDFIVEGRVTSVEYDTNGKITTDPNGPVSSWSSSYRNAYPNRTAAIAGWMRRPWKLSNIKVQNMEVFGKGHTGGLVACVETGSSSSGVRDYEFEDCLINGADKGTLIESYGGSTGGMIAVVTQMDYSTSPTGTININLNGCGVIGGSKTQPVQIKVHDRAIDSLFGTYYSSDYGTRDSVGRSGGFIGYVGRKDRDSGSLNTVNVKIANTSTNPAKVTLAEITGVYSTGGLIGEYDAGYNSSTNTAPATAPVIIESAEVSDSEILGTRGNTSDSSYYNYGVGGLIGEMRAGKLTITPGSGQNIILERTNVTSSFKSNYGLYAGGVVGCLKVNTAEFRNITMSGYAKGTTTLGNSKVELGGQTYTVKSAVSDAGGIIGHASYGSGTLTMSGIHVEGMNIAVAENQADDEILSNTTINYSVGSAGGVIGSNQMQLTLKNNDSSKSDAEKRGTGALIEYCKIMGYANSVGGIIGIAERNLADGSNTVNVRSSDIEDIIVRKNIIGLDNIYSLVNNSSTYAGGVYGQIGANYRYSGTALSTYTQRVENASIEDNWIYAYYAGGVTGYVNAYHLVYSNQKALVVNNNNLYGRIIGGAMGYSGSARVNYIGTQITGNRLQAYGPSGSSAYAGGFIGSATQGQSATTHRYDLDNLMIKENYILAANAGTVDIGAGGLFGYANSYNCYVYQPTIKDNLIGYSECDSGKALRTSGATYDTLHKLFNSTNGEIGVGNATAKTRTASLITGTSSLTATAMPSVANLRSDSIGYYSARIGNLIGRYNASYAATAHTYILEPQISYSDAITTRPVIDVGRATGTAKSSSTQEEKNAPALLSAPYEYRRNTHIIYYNPLPATGDADATVWNGLDIDIDGDGVRDTNTWQDLFNGISYTNLIADYDKTASTTSLSEYLDAYRLYAKADPDALDNIRTMYTQLYTDRNNSASLAGTDNNTKLPIVFMDLQHGTPDQLMKSVIAALTGMGGVYNSTEDSAYAYSEVYGMGSITKITAEPMKISINSGKISLNKGAVSTLKVDGEKTGKLALSYRDFDDNGRIYEDANDTAGKLVNDQTFTLLTVTYSWGYSGTGATGGSITRTAEIRIPVFVEERLNIDTHMMIVEGLEYNAEKAKANGQNSNVYVANDSSYTLYMEYIYSRARTKYNVQIPKFLGAQELMGDGETYKPVGFPAGTKLTLIDVDDNNKVYYYTVTKENADKQIEFKDFVDEEGNPYKYKYINHSTKTDNAGFTIVEEDPWKTDDWIWNYSKEDGYVRDHKETFEYTNSAVERFLLNVDISGVADNDRIKSATRYVDNKLTLDEQIRGRTTLTEHTRLETRILEGITIQFYHKDMPDEDEKTWIDGKISADENEGFVDIWATFEVGAGPAYWTLVSREEESIIDSANKDKYLELQIFMTEVGDAGGSEIMLPAGTFVSIEGVRTQPPGIVVPEQEDHIDRTSLPPYNDAANIFYYKDGKLLFEMNALSKIMSAELDAERVDIMRPKVTAVRWDTYLRLDFRAATNMQSFDQENYGININLLRIENPNYPVGGEVKDTYSRNLAAKRPDDLACALEVKDLLQLGINTYDNQADLPTEMPHFIDFDFKMDFTGVWGESPIGNQAIADMYYTAAYRIWEKKFAADGESYEYVPYTGNKLSLMDSKGEELKKAIAQADSGPGLDFWYVDYEFSYDEINIGTRGYSGNSQNDTTDQGGVIEGSDAPDIEPGKNVIIRDLQLKVDDGAYEMDLSNYKVQVIVFPNDFGYGTENSDGKKLEIKKSDLDYESSLSDFFVFTVAKLKTDLDY